MKTVITSTGNSIASAFDLRFGRAVYFCVYDSATDEVEFIENKHKDDQGGVGTTVSEMLIEMGVEKVISGDFGPKAKGLLEKFNVQMVILQNDSRNVEKILETIK